MDIALTEQQKLLKEAAKRFLTSECPVTMVREMETDRLGYSPTVWKKMAGLGWLKLPFPREYGGEAGAFFDLALVAEQMGIVLLLSPFINTIAAGLAVMRFGSEEQKKAILPAIGSGSLTLSLAMYEPGMGLDAKSVGTVAERRDEQYLLFGTKTFVADWQSSGKALVVTRTEMGVTVFLLDTASAGAIAEPLSTMVADKQCEVTFRGVRLSRGDILGTEDGGWCVVEQVLKDCACLTSAYSVGAAAKTLSMSKEYAKQRQQFGKPIGNFQAIQHKLADMMVLLEGARLLTYEAAWRLSRGLPADFEVAAAKVWTAESFHRIAEEAMRIHASMGYSMECDVQLYYRRATALRAFWGDPYYHRERVAQLMGI